MWEGTSGSVSRDFWRGRFQPLWCSSQHSFLSRRKNKKKTLNLRNMCCVTVWVFVESWLKSFPKKDFITYLPLWSSRRQCRGYIYCKRRCFRIIIIINCDSEKSITATRGESKKQGCVFPKCCISRNMYLRDSMPFFVARTKKGNLSFLVTSTSPPLLSIAPKWIAARQILDFWNKWTNMHLQISIYETYTIKDVWCLLFLRWTDSPHRRREFPRLSLSYSCS